MCQLLNPRALPTVSMGRVVGLCSQETLQSCDNTPPVGSRRFTSFHFECTARVCPEGHQGILGNGEQVVNTPSSGCKTWVKVIMAFEINYHTCPQQSTDQALQPNHPAF
eukprot:3469521-Amphidinium_carterae.1